MAIVNFQPRCAAPNVLHPFLQGCSIEVMPRTLAKIDDLSGLMPDGTRIYIAHIDGTGIDDMVSAARRIHQAGFTPMPHIPARLVQDHAQLRQWVRRYQSEAGVTQALLLAGGIKQPKGMFDNAIQLLDSGAFDGFDRLHVAGHPEGSRDIDPDGGDTAVMQALAFKQAFADRSDAKMALVTQFVFDADPVISWAEGLRTKGITMPIHVGLAGPAKLQALIKFAVACGVGPSLSVLQKRARDVTKLLKPFEPTEIATRLARYKAAHPNSLIEAAHFFPLGGITTNATWIAHHRKDQHYDPHRP
ncbi:5,10-methylenetetrahydrofolate reductase [Thioclava sp. SK-1]|uniref:5,10-methylenetetrahydrofolate reductase n=1 Tax=Thioclava sp. SK-1 TaxID=1889770 RepID=UPI0008263FA4|nr:5,10-methylenetetrahydrofolate reductase [Thioclava sp. SK-1]OCX66148.1 5,10-methylenetetrahydrofolate reductase [Thioclava sp. SK-1]